MTRLSDREIEKLLSVPVDADPPADLLDRLRDDIPSDISWAPDSADSPSPDPDSDPRTNTDTDTDTKAEPDRPGEVVPLFPQPWVYALAATLVMALGAVLLAPRILRQSMPESSATVAEDRDRAASAGEVATRNSEPAPARDPLEAAAPKDGTVDGTVDSTADRPDATLARSSVADDGLLSKEDVGADNELRSLGYAGERRQTADGSADDESSRADARLEGTRLGDKQADLDRTGAMAKKEAPLPTARALPPSSPRPPHTPRHRGTQGPEEQGPEEQGPEELRSANREEEIVVVSELPVVDESQLPASAFMLPEPATEKAEVPKPSRADASQSRRTRPAPPPPPPPPASPAPAPAEAGSEAEAKQLDEATVTLSARPSTTNSAPNNAPYADAYFEAPGTNPFIDTEDDRLSTFALDVDTGSYGIVRSYLEEGHLPPKAAVRPEEMLNYFDYGDPPPVDGSDFALRAQGAPSPFGEGERYYLLRVGLRARDIPAAQRPPALLTFVVDTSGSMRGGGRLELVKQALLRLLEQLQEKDRVALVTYGNSAKVVAWPTHDKKVLAQAISALYADGSTNAEAGLTVAYRLTVDHRQPGHIHRVILCSDGVANVGAASAEALLQRVSSWASQGVELTTVGVGMGNYNDVLLEQLADKGNGRYAYVDDLPEAERLFVENLSGTLQTVAADARAQVEFDPEVVARYRLVGYENRDLADNRFRDNTADAGEIGAGHSVTALYELKTHRRLRARQTVATVRLRWASVAGGEFVEKNLDVRGRDFAPSFERAPRDLQLAALVAEMGEILKGAYWARNGDLQEVFVRLQRVAAQYPGDAQVAELASLAGRAAKLWRQQHGSPTDIDPQP